MRLTGFQSLCKPTDLPHSWHEHDPLEIISSVEQCIDGAVKDLETQGHASSNIKAVGITNQRETTVRHSLYHYPMLFTDLANHLLL